MATSNDSTERKPFAAITRPEYSEFSIKVENQLHNALALLRGADSIVDALVDGQTEGSRGPDELPYLQRIFDMLETQLNSTIEMVDGSFNAYVLKSEIAAAS
jgi:hypothetical protein